jgi:hypothetical protein
LLNNQIHFLEFLVFLLYIFGAFIMHGYSWKAQKQFSSGLFFIYIIEKMYQWSSSVLEKYVQWCLLVVHM